MQKAIISMVTMLTLVSSSSRAEELRSFALDDVSSASPMIATDADVKVEGSGSLRITTKWPTTVYLREVAALDVDNAKLVYSAKVKSALEGIAFLEMWAHVGGGQYFARGLDDSIAGTSDWKTVQTPFVFQKGQKPDKVTLNIVINGTGTVWIDDIILSKEPLN